MTGQAVSIITSETPKPHPIPHAGIPILGTAFGLIVAVALSGAQDPIWRVAAALATVTALVAVAAIQRPLLRRIDQMASRERELSEELERRQKLMDHIPLPLSIRDGNGVFTHCNTAFLELTGRSSRDVIGLMSADVFGAAAGRLLDQDFERALGHPGTLRLEMALPDQSGAARDVIIYRSAHFPPNGGSGAFVISVTLEDTERKRAERALRDQVAFLSTLLDTIPSPIYYKDRSGRYLGCNSAFAAIHGRTVDQVVGQRAGDLMEPGMAGLDDNTDLCLMMLEDPFQVYETQIDLADGSRHDILFSKALYRQFDGSVGGLVGVMTDTTDRNWHELEIAAARDQMARQAEDLKRSNAELEQFAYVASHDLREPLRMVNSYLSLLERRYGDKLDKDAHDFIDFARDGGKRMDRLILDLLEYSRVGRRGGPPGPISMAEVIDTARRNLEVAFAERGAVLTLAADLPVVLGDDTELTRLFQNLIGNAIKYCAPDVTPEIAIDWTDEPGFWRFGVGDTGLGIAPEHFERIFMVFQRLHGRGEYDGTGIGLAICRKIVEHHGGRIWVTSEPGRGSTFHFTLAKSRDSGPVA
ncbi:ATPase [Skermanella stibiiresistens SB22]|uniref:histidine kinase n=1 Tax=Skermanella stibiiresistens SB22 TaxID=1385369 RepID=W9GY33_9PROT|nr:ATP-binding protein [Skermanella stibiiresistens]EWY37357.1 ATPase [Skermanella stibiiresistens SB22]